MTDPAADQPTQKASLLPWLIWGLGAFLFTYAHFQRVAPGVMVDALMREFAVGGTLLGNLSATYFYTYALFQVPAGLVVDAYGSRRIMFLSTLLVAVGSLVFAEAGSVSTAFLGRLLVGVGGGATFVVAFNLAAVWFPPARFPLLSGLTISLGVAGAVLGQVPLAWAVDAFGWRAAMLGATAAVTVACVGAWMVLRVPRPKPRGAVPRNMVANLRAVLARGDLWLLTGAAVGNMSVMLTFGGLWGVPWLVQTYGMGRSQAALAVTCSAIGWVLGSPFVGALGQRLGRRKALFLFLNLVNLACYAFLILVPGHSFAVIAALLVVQGVATGAVVLVFNTTHERFAGGQEGVSVGIVNTGIMLGAATLQPLVGWVLDRHWNGVMAAGARTYDAAAYQSGLAVLLGGGAVALVCGLLMPDTRRGGGAH